MELIINPLISPTLPIFSKKFYFKKTCKMKASSSRLTIPNSKNLPFHSPFSNPSRFKLYAHFRQPTKRQNYLRKKLTEQQQQQEVSKISIINNPSLSNVSEAKFDNFIDKKSSFDDNSDAVNDVKELETKKRLLGDDSVLWNRLESWVEQYKKDIEFWGIGTVPIFTVFKESQGKVERVEVNEDEILRRSGIEPSSSAALYKDRGSEDVMDVNSKISYAKDLAREMESGNDVLSRNSSVAKFVVSGAKSGFVNVIQGGKSGFVNVIQGVTRVPDLFPKMSRLSVAVLVGFIVVRAVRKLFTVGEDRQEYTILEKEMLRRKLNARAEREKIVKGSVEILQESVEPECVPVERPGLDREELMKNIIKAKGSNDILAVEEHSGNKKAKSEQFSDKIQEIRTMARRAREIENRDASSGNNDGEDIQNENVLYNQMEVVQQNRNGYLNSQVNFPDGNSRHIKDDSVTTSLTSSDDLIKSSETQTSKALHVNIHTQSSAEDVGDNDQNLLTSGAREVDQQSDSQASKPSSRPLKTGLRVIRSVEEAREYLSRKREKQDVDLEPKARNAELDDTFLTVPSERKTAENTGQRVGRAEKVFDASAVSVKPDLTNSSENTTCKEKEYTLTNNSNAEAEEVDGGRMSENGKSTPFLSNQGSHSSQTNEMPLSILPREKETDGNSSQEKNKDNKTFSPSILVIRSDFNSTSIARETLELEKKSSIPQEQIYCDNVEEGKEVTDRPASIARETLELEKKSSIPQEQIYCDNIEEGKEVIDRPVPGTSVGQGENSRCAELEPSLRAKNWMEKNFHELEPIIKKMGVVFRENYIAAKDKMNQDMNSKPEMIQLNANDNDSELAWMKDEMLRDIVFKVRDNELAGRDPFHLMDDKDKLAFFNGLEKKVEEENKKLGSLHEWLHSNIENLDYGADGISLYDPPEKIIPRWKGPPLDEIPEFLNNSMEQKMEALAENDTIKPMGQDSPQNAKESASNDIVPSPSVTPDLHSKVSNEITKSSKTIIQGSDGSMRAGKKTGKEFWQHTKKWSQGFLDSYNAETDPEIKSVMKDMGKDLDRWITEKEIQEAAELMDKLPETGKKYIKEKLDKVRREVELFGPQAVVSKYREYGDEKEEDYLWWLDLPYVLCIELYTEEEGEQRVGLYSLEMAPDLELSPKPYHVIAFEDAGDCKSLCYIIQHHLEMLGNGNAFVISRPPKDAFREAKANGFSVTVIRKGELQLNVDQALEEVEELITEIGSKIYHDSIMRERSADINALMKGVFGLKKPSRRRKSRRKLKKPTRP